jgi:hypothetical protein
LEALELAYGALSFLPVLALELRDPENVAKAAD